MFGFRRKQAQGRAKAVVAAVGPGARRADGAKASATAGIAGRALPGGFARGGFAARDGGSLVRSGFLDNPIGFRAVRLIAEAAAGVPLVVSGSEGRYAAHPVADLLTSPNGSQGRAAFLESLYGQIVLSGDGFVEGVGDGVWPVELHVLRSDRMSVVPGPDGWPVGYDYVVGGAKHRFTVAESSSICHVRTFHPTDDHHGLSPLRSAAVAIDVHNAAATWSKSLLDNAARPSGAIVNEGEDLTEEQFERLSAELAAHHQGSRNAGRPLLLDGGLSWHPMGLSPADMEFRAIKESAAREVATAFGVPPMLLGIPGDATYANYAEANRAFYRLTVLPLVARVAEALAAWLKSWNGAARDAGSAETVMLAADRDRIPALQDERDAQWRRVAEASFLSDAEKRRLLNLPVEEA